MDEKKFEAPPKPETPRDEKILEYDFLNDTETSLSELRSRFYEELRKLLPKDINPNDFDARVIKKPTGWHSETTGSPEVADCIEGEIRGHSISIILERDSRGEAYGEIDGKTMPGKIATLIASDFRAAAYLATQYHNRMAKLKVEDAVCDIRPGYAVVLEQETS